MRHSYFSCIIQAGQRISFDCAKESDADCTPVLEVRRNLREYTTRLDPVAAFNGKCTGGNDGDEQ
ncbi:MAG: hypothetical protein ACXV76_02650 [Halobacteriota archaeon]